MLIGFLIGLIVVLAGRLDRGGPADRRDSYGPDHGCDRWAHGTPDLRR
jgi:hypothetical protein